MEKKYLRRKEAATYLKVSLRTLSNWQHKRLIPFLRVGRRCVLFKPTDLDWALKKFEIKAVNRRRGEK